MKYPIGIQNFSQIIEDGYVYADKTVLAYDLVKKGMSVFSETGTVSDWAIEE